MQSGFLKAIESGAYEKLPAQTFAVGFVRSYALALELDANEIVTSFKAECGMTKPIVAASAVSPASQQQSKPHKKIPGWLSPIAGLVGASVVWLALGTGFSGAALVAERQDAVATEEAQLAALQSGIIAAPVETPTMQQISNEDPVHAALVVEAKEAEPASSSLFLPAAYAGVEAPALTSGVAIVLEASEDSWVRVARPDGTELWSGILRAGQAYRPYEAGEMLLTTSNAGGLTLIQGSDAAVGLGARGEIVTDYAVGY